MVRQSQRPSSDSSGGNWRAPKWWRKLQILELRNVTKTFGGLRALDDVSFRLSEGEIMSIIGPNGSGKTTLFNVICGFYKPDGGTIHFNGRDITGLKPHQICRLGIGRAFQIEKLFTSMNVYENVHVASLYGRGEDHHDGDLRRYCLDILEFVGLSRHTEFDISRLTAAEKKRLEMARALATAPTLILLDEVMAGLNAVEVDGVSETIKSIRSRGITVLMVEHVMRSVMTISDRIVVLHFGDKIAEGKPKEISENETVVRAYLGRDGFAKSRPD